MAAPSLHVYVHAPAVAFKARTNMPGAITYPITALVFDGVTVGAFGDVFTDMTLLLGTAEGLDDLGRTRVQNVATSTTIPVGRISQGLEDGTLDVQDNAYITVFADDFRVWSKPVYIADNGDIFKDSDVAVGTWTTTEPPVANTGPAFAATIDSITDLITVEFPAGGNDLSFAVADGATITGYAWNVKDGTITVGSATDVVITATFPAGFRYVELTVTDSNALTHTARVPVYALDPDNDTTLQHYTIERHHAEQSGQELDIRILDDLSRSTYPDGTLVMFWDGEPIVPTDRSNIQFVGWEQSLSTNVQGTRTGTLKDTVLHCVDAGGRLQALGSFEQSLERKATVTNFTEMVNPTMDKYIHYLLHWHSTALAVADYFPSDTGDDYPFVLFGSNGSSLWEQVANEAKGLVPGHIFTCNRKGQLAVSADPFLQDEADRTVAIQHTFDEDTTEQITFDYTRPPKVARIRGSALLTATDYTDVAGVPTLLTVQCITPGYAPSQGMNDVQTNEGLAQSQNALNSAKGHEYARANSRYGMMNLTPADDDSYYYIEPANLDWVRVNLTAETAALRGFAFSNVRTQCKSIDFRYSDNETGVVRRSQFVLEPETVGRPAITVIPEGSSAVPVDPIPPPDMGLITGQEVVAGIGKFKVYRTSDFQTVSGSGGPTWDAVDLTGADEILTWVVDPFSPGYAPGATSGSVDGWLATATAVYRVEDIFGTPSVSAQVTFANTASWRTVQASFGAYFFAGLNPWLICISYYGSLGGHTGTWATYSMDGGATWADEVLVSAFYDSGGAVNPIALFTSPRTPGYGLTAAHTATTNPGVTHGFTTSDWGATWTEMTATEDPVELMPGFGEFDDNGSGVYTYLGPSPSATITETATSTGPTINLYETLIIAPPEDTKRMVVLCTWTNEATKTGGFGSQGSGLIMSKDGTVSRTGSSNYSQAVVNAGPLSGSFSCEYTFGSYLTNDWPGNRQDTEATPPTTSSGYVRYTINVGADADASNTRTTTANITLTVTEIELDSGLIYVPTTPGVILPIHGSAGQIHIPWIDNADEGLIYYGSLSRTANRLFDLKKVAAGVLSSISPNDGTRDYGAHAGQFAIRAFDSDRQFMLAAVTGNDTTGSSSGDKQGIYFSSNAGGSWSNIVAPTTSTEVYQAAFAGDDSAVQFYWGPPLYIGYSSNSGSSIDSRAGNLSALSATRLIGICGGPS